MIGHWDLNHLSTDEALDSLVDFMGPPTDAFLSLHNLLWNRDNIPERIDNRITDQDSGLHWCRALHNRKTEFCRQGTVDVCDPDQIRIFVGHCIQSLINFELSNRTYTLVESEDQQTETLTTRNRGDVYVGPPDPTQRHVFGITMECPLDPEDLYSIYRVDVGAARGQFFNSIGQTVAQGDDGYLTPEESETFYLLSRSPQVVEIKTDRINIIRSRTRNTRIHVPRPEYERDVGEVLPLRVSNLVIEGLDQPVTRSRRKSRRRPTQLQEPGDQSQKKHNRAIPQESPLSPWKVPDSPPESPLSPWKQIPDSPTKSPTRTAPQESQPSATAPPRGGLWGRLQNLIPKFPR